MNVFFHLFIFILILIIYINITNQHKKNNELEIYEMDYTDNNNLQEICKLKLPVLFNYNTIHPDFIQELNDDIFFDKIKNYDVKVKDIRDYWNNTDSVDYVVLQYNSANNLMITDTHSAFFTENNHSCLDEADLLKSFQSNDQFLKQPLTVNATYDILTGSNGAYTPLKYHINERYFLGVISGKITIKLTPYKSSKYLYPNKDYDMFEFWSPINVWKPQDKYYQEMEKIKFLEVDVNAGHMIYIPPYWWYSIKYSNQKDNLVAGFTYNSIMNCMANLPSNIIYYIQQNNINKRIAKSASNIMNDDENEENNDENDDENTNIADIDE